MRSRHSDFEKAFWRRMKQTASVTLREKNKATHVKQAIS
jgi:hypothetical protein